MAVKKRALIIDNSVSWTGAYAGAAAISKLVKDEFDVFILLNSRSSLLAGANELFKDSFSLPMLEIRKSVFSLFFYIPFLIINTIRLRFLIKKHKIDVVVINDYYNLMGVMLKIIFWRGRVVTFVRYMPLSQNKILNFIWSRLAILVTDVVVPVSFAVAQQLPSCSRIKVVYNPSIFDDVAFTKKGLGESFVFLYVSNYIKGKGQDCAIKAFAKSFCDCSDVELHLCGSDMGLDKNALWKRQLKNIALELGVLEKVVFDDFDPDVLTKIQRSDVVLNFSGSESFSQTCYEAISCGRPVISTDSGGPREIIKDGVSGYLVPVGDVDAMSEKMRQLYIDQDMRFDMGLAGFNDSKLKFSKEKIKSDLLDVMGLV